MEIPPEALVSVCIEQGSICHFRLDATNQDGTAYSGDRFLIVLNTNPKTDTVLVLTTLTTKIERQKKLIKIQKESPDTLVVITPQDFPRLDRESIVNCNKVYEFSKDELTEKIRDGGKVFFEKLPKSIVSALVSGTVKSRQVSNEHKQLMI
jgi:hypothetical protein